MDLKLDGTFVQTIERSGNPKLQFQKGKWKINGSDLIIKVLKPVHDGSDEPWFLDWARWWIMDSRQKGLKFGIIGAADDRDPDNCFEFKKITLNERDKTKYNGSKVYIYCMMDHFSRIILGWKAETESVSKPSEKSNTIRS